MSRVKAIAFWQGLYSTLSKYFFSQWQSEKCKVYSYTAPGAGQTQRAHYGSHRRQLEEGSVGGSLLNEGWGAEMGYQGIVLDNSGNRVNGFLFRSANLVNHWPTLDAFAARG